MTTTRTIYVVMGGMSCEGSHTSKAFASETAAKKFAEWCQGDGCESAYGGADFYYVEELELEE